MSAPDTGLLVSDMESLSLELLNVRLAMNMEKSPLKTDEDHLKDKRDDFVELVQSIEGVNTTTRLAVADRPDLSRTLPRDIFDAIIVIPYMTGKAWHGAYVGKIAAIRLVLPEEATTRGPSTAGTRQSVTGQAGDTKVDNRKRNPQQDIVEKVRVSEACHCNAQMTSIVVSPIQQPSGDECFSRVHKAEHSC